MKKYVIAGGILLGGLFLMNGGGIVIGMAFAHVVAFLIKAILLIDWHWGLVAISWSTINRLCRCFNGTWCDFVAILFIILDPKWDTTILNLCFIKIISILTFKKYKPCFKNNLIIV